MELEKKMVTIVDETANFIFNEVITIIKEWDARGMPAEYSIRSIRAMQRAWNKENEK